MDTFNKFLPLLIFIVVAVLVLKFLSPLWLKFKLKRIMKFKPIISIEDKNGFILYLADKAVRKIKWTEIDSIELAGRQKLQLLFRDKSVLSIQEKEYEGWLSLVRAIPENMPVNNALSSYKADRFSNLSCCKVCGKIAVKNDECLNCITDTYEKYCKDAEDFGGEIKTERAFIKENQLDWFTGFIDGSKVDFYAKEILYDDCPGWAPSVTAFEVIKYEKKLDDANPS